MGRRGLSAGALTTVALGLAVSGGIAAGAGRTAVGVGQVSAAPTANLQPAAAEAEPAPVLLATPAAHAAAKPKWTTPMKITRPGGCDLFPGLRGTSAPLTGQQWHRSAGYRLGWRYRVNATWTLVLDYARSDVAHRPRWAFIETSCLKNNKYPAIAKDSHGHVRNLWGRSSHGWRHVRFGMTHLPGVHTTGTRTVVVAYTTVRDNPNPSRSATCSPDRPSESPGGAAATTPGPRARARGSTAETCNPGAGGG